MKWDKKSGSDANHDQVIDCKVVVIGDAYSGKTSLICRATSDLSLSVTYVPTCFEKYALNTVVNNSRFCLNIWDTSGSSSYDTVRPLAFKDASVFLITFDLADCNSLTNVLNKWFPEVHQLLPDVPIILCGCKSDRRTASTLDSIPSTSSSSSWSKTSSCDQSGRFDISKVPVFTEQALDVSRQINAITYVETSSLEDNHSALEAFKLCALAAKGFLIGSNSLNRLKKSSSLSTLTRCKSILKLRKCKSRADFSGSAIIKKIDEEIEETGPDGKNCIIM